MPSSDADGEHAERPEQTFARRFAQVRQASNLTQVQIAFDLEMKGRVKLDHSAIARIEKGQRAIKLDEAVALAAELDMSVDEMLRPAMPPDEQIEAATKAIERFKWRAATAIAEYEVAQDRLKRLKKRLGRDEDGGGDDGERGEAPGRQVEG